MIRTIIADDHRLFRVGLSRILKDASGIEVIGTVASGEEAVIAAREHRPHVILMDLLMPGVGGLEASRRIGLMEAGIRVLAVTACTEEPYPSQALKAGMCGYVTKGASPEEMITAVRRAYAGQKFVSSDVAQRLAFRSFEDNADSCPFEQLSTREMQVTLMVINCHRVQDISDNLHLSPKTVNSYRYRIFEKLSVSSDVELALLAVRHGMINPQVGSLVQGT